LAAGFDESTSEEIALAANELASNLARHAQGGQLTLGPVTEGGRIGIQIESLDRGPGIPDVEQAMTDGFSTLSGLGCGLGAVNRLMDEFTISSREAAPAGTYIVCKRWLREDTKPADPCPLEFGGASRACPSMTMNGDAFAIKRWSTNALVAVIDGLGHGQYAHRAAQAARHYVDTHFDQALDAIFRGVGRTCRGTRGVVMALAKFKFGGNGVRFCFASVGDVEARLFGGSRPEHFIVRRGILGGNAPNASVTEHRWEAGNLLVLHSDGLTRHWGLEDFPGLSREPATAIAQRLLSALATKHDDATVVVVRGTTGER
jgi:anti-sigma regulatory factor (Ser/Thr protein kinase)/serine/threonine protein phosphatase PrpC